MSWTRHSFLGGDAQRFFKARKRGGHELVLLDEAGDDLEERADTSRGSVRLAWFWDDCKYSGLWMFPIGIIVPALVFCGNFDWFVTLRLSLLIPFDDLVDMKNTLADRGIYSITIPIWV